MLELQQLGYRYPGSPAPALQDISLHIQAGECIGLLGSNGAGKTTLLSLIAGLILPQQGSLRWHADNAIGLVPQSLAFHSRLRVSENLQLFADLYRLRGTKRQHQLEQVIDATQLEPLLKRTAAQLSGGQQRRLNFALGLLQPAQLYLLDEATVGVDSGNRQRMLQAVRELAGNGSAVLYTSHYLPEIEQLASRVLLLSEGHLLLDRQLEEQPAQQFSVRWSNAIPQAVLQRCRDRHWPFSQQGNRLELELNDPQQLPELLHLLASQPAPVQLDYGPASLEQLYLQSSGGQL
mgnify:CR=1 FL=1